jgi:di/tricarboxylate transporter
LTWEVFFILALLAFAVVSFLLEKFSADQTAITIFGVLLAVGLLPGENSLPSTNELLSVFASPAPITIAAMFILSAALEKCGVIRGLASALDGMVNLGYRRFLLILVPGVAGISAFINNTPVVIVFLPVILNLARKMEIPASKFLIPLSYAAIFGGTCTLVGTSTNILASSILEDEGAPPIGMFEIAGIGLPLLFVGTLYLVFFGDKILPVRETLSSLLSEAERKEFLTEAFIQAGSPLVGKPVEMSELQTGFGLRVVEIIRHEVAIPVNPQKTTFEEGDRLILACRPAGFAHARTMSGIDFAAFSGAGLEAISAHEGLIVEGVIGPNATVIGETISDINFRQRFRTILLAVHRRGVNLRDKIGAVRLEAGDLLLMMGTEQAIQQLRSNDDIFLLDQPATPAKSRRKKLPLVLATVAAVILAASLNLVPIVAAALIGVTVIYLSRVLSPKEGYGSIEWSIIFLIYGMLGLGLAMQTTGTAELLATGLLSVTDVGFISAGLKPYVALALLYFMTMVLTETVSNNATVVLMTPLALSLGSSLEVDPRGFVIATCIAASASFSTPIGYQTNTYVYGVAGYRFTDFTRAGLPLNALYFLTSVLLIPRIWPF